MTGSKSMMFERSDLRNAARQAGFVDLALDEAETRTGALIKHDGVRQRVFLRTARNASRLAVERAALDLARPAALRLPTPEVVGVLQAGGDQILLLSYEAGSDLAVLLPHRPGAPPLPPGYVRRGYQTVDDPGSLFADIGRAVRTLHTISLPAFGKFVGDEPNPHRSAAQQFTRQEALHRLRRCQDRCWLDHQEARAVDQWLEAHLSLIHDDEPPVLVHYDLHPGNIRINESSPGTWSLRALLDWELARGWLAEYDLAMLSWYVRSVDEGWWRAFLQGYGHSGPGVWDRLRLFEMIRALGAMAYSERGAAWGEWGRRRAQEIVARALRTPPRDDL